jgi:hypothetical protein
MVGGGPAAMKTPTLDNRIVDLGQDGDRMTVDAAAVQQASVNRLLRAFFGPPHARREVQMLADEVGLGKTFVALAVAYSVLTGLRERTSPAFVSDLANAYRAVVVLTPQGNHALAAKWADEVGAFVKRCSRMPEAMQWFTSVRCETPEDLLIALRKASDLRRRPGTAPTVIVCEAGIFTRRIRESGPKLRFLTATLFKWLGTALRHDVRRHMIRRAAEVRGYEDWAEGIRRGEDVELWDFIGHARFLDLPVDDPARQESIDRRDFEAVPFRYEEMRESLTRHQKTERGTEFLYGEGFKRSGDEGPVGIVPYCKWVADKRGKAELFFDGFKSRVSELYRDLFPFLMTGTLPLVIADEAHHWRRETEGCRSFLRYIAPFTHRLLLLTATPFQLGREELDCILSRGDAMERTIGEERVGVLQDIRGRLLAAMEKSEEAGHAFSKQWGHLADNLRAARKISEGTVPDPAEDALALTQAVAEYWQSLTAPGRSTAQQLLSLPGRVRPFFSDAIRLREANASLGQIMRELIIRHRRDTAHRRYRVGREYPPLAAEPDRPDQHQLHAARGRTLPGDAELAQFLLMKVVASATRGRRKTTLGMDVTGAYSTLWNSSEGKRALAAAEQNEAPPYYRLLARLTGGQGIPNRADPEHPKVRLVVDTALDCWEHDEKTLIFCFRVPTAQVLLELIAKRIEKHIGNARSALLRGHQAANDAAAMMQFKKSLTARTGSVLPAFMDRVLTGYAAQWGWPTTALEDAELDSIADLASRARISGRPAISDVQRPDRVLLSRISESVLAGKYQRMLVNLDHKGRQLLAQVSSSSWIETRYGIGGPKESEAEDGESTDLLIRSGLSVTYELANIRDDTIYRALLASFQRSRAANRAGLLDSLVAGPNLFVPLPPFELDPNAQVLAKRMTEQLWAITAQTGDFNWNQRGGIVDAVNRALLRDHFLLRLPQEVFSGKKEQWSEALVRGFHSDHLFGRRGESLARRISDYLGELAQMTDDERLHSLRYALNAQGKAVVLVSGTTGERDAVFRGFNSPLLPEILICTQVGQEGIDLHRHCSHVIHYDLGWNPATVEQRTGRVDRIGSKNQRERKLAHDDGGGPDAPPGLEIALPYLAATYDERMFDRLYSRAQSFDLLMGGDPAADPDDASDSPVSGPDHERSSTEFVALPDDIRAAIRVDLRARLED